MSYIQIGFEMPKSSRNPKKNQWRVVGDVVDLQKQQQQPICPGFDVILSW